MNLKLQWVPCCNSKSMGIGVWLRFSMSRLTSSPWLLLCQLVQIDTHPVKHVTFTWFLNLGQTFAIFREQTIVLQIPCFVAMSEAQVSDPDLAKLQSDSSLQLQHIPLPLSDGAFIISDMSTSTSCPFMPECFQRPIYDSLNSWLRSGIRATKHMLTSIYIWHCIYSDVRTWARTCLHARNPRYIVTLLLHYSPFLHLMLALARSLSI